MPEVIETYANVLNQQPSKPTELQLVNTTTTTATVSWSLPEHLNGVLDQWHLTWSWRNDSANETDLGASQMQYAIENLLPDTTYYIHLRARTGAGLGDSATIDITTGKTSSSYRIGMIVGASVGLLVLVAAVGCGVYFYRKRSRTKAPSLASDMELEATEARDTHDTYSSELYKHQQQDYWQQRYSIQQQTDNRGAAGVKALLNRRRESQANINGDHSVRGASQVTTDEDRGKVSSMFGQRRTSLVFDGSEVRSASGLERTPRVNYGIGDEVSNVFGQRRGSRALENTVMY
ncbi:uncharacterized protein [Panulirus ornatus]|uniref:uncharacterized protein n=1 Tax=Panulirus ornatus TaxID=150431 RepID=UPI003A8812C1